MIGNKDIYSLLSNGGAISMPYLVEIKHETLGVIYMTNNTDDITYNGNVYKKAAFKYNRPSNKNGSLQSGSLNIALLSDFYNIFDFANGLIEIRVVGLVADYDSIVPINYYRYRYCTMSVASNMEVEISFLSDDKLNMVFPPYVFDNDNNRGN